MTGLTPSRCLRFRVTRRTILRDVSILGRDAARTPSEIRDRPTVTDQGIRENSMDTDISPASTREPLHLERRRSQCAFWARRTAPLRRCDIATLRQHLVCVLQCGRFQRASSATNTTNPDRSSRIRGSITWLCTETSRHGKSGICTITLHRPRR